jgi:hypothetical protein
MAKSHPTYDQWGKKAGTLESRMKKVETLYAYSEERAKFEESWYEEHGKAWWLFQGTTIRHNVVQKSYGKNKDKYFNSIWDYYVSDRKKEGENE